MSDDNWYQKVVYGGVAGGVAALSTSPLELLKTRMQSNHSQVHALQQSKDNIVTFMARCTRDVIRKEGMSGLWKGATPTIIGSIPSRGIFFGVYTASQNYLSRQYPDRTTGNCLISSCLGGLVSTTLTSPIWMIKTRMQLNEQKTPASLYALYQNIIQREGVRSLWKGIGASWMGVLETCTQWLILEHIKHHRTNNDTSSMFLYASVSKLLATAMWYPHEVIRTRMREKNSPYRNIAHCAVQIARSESLSAFYAGLKIQLIRVVPNFALTVFIFNLLNQ